MAQIWGKHNDNQSHILLTWNQWEFFCFLFLTLIEFDINEAAKCSTKVVTYVNIVEHLYFFIISISMEHI
jgi:hypothetical protein